MLGICALGPKVFITDTELPRDEFVLWQEGGQLLIMKAAGREAYRALKYEIEWAEQPDRSLVGEMTSGGASFGAWRVSPRGSKLEMELFVRNPETERWEVAEAFFCYKHKGSASFWDATLDRTYVEWEAEPVTLRRRLEALAPAEPIRFKHHLHRRGFEECFERYENVSLRNPESAGWRAFREAATGGWMAIQSVCGRRVSGIYWEGTEMLAQNAPDYGCLHAGAALGYGIAPGEARRVRGTLHLGEMTIAAFQDAHRADLEKWRAAV